MKMRAGVDTGLQCQKKQGTVLCAGGRADKNHIQCLAGAGSMEASEAQGDIDLRGVSGVQRGAGGEAVCSAGESLHADFPV